MAAIRVRYKGIADRRVISAKDLARHGVTIDKDLEWNRENGFALTLEGTPRLEEILRKEKHFSISAVTDEGADGSVVATATDTQDTGDKVVDASTGATSKGSRRS